MEDLLIKILALPLIIYFGFLHLLDSIISLKIDLSDKYFLKKSRMSKKQFVMFLKWRQSKINSGQWEEWGKSDNGEDGI